MITFKNWCKQIENGPEGIASFFMIYGAKTYIPLGAKINLINLAVREGDSCIINTDSTGYATVDTAQKYLFLMYVYLTAYYGVDFEGEDFTDSDYDLILEHNYQNRINRLVDRKDIINRSDYDYITIRRQIVEQQNDFKLFEKMLNKELSDECARRNDVQKRLATLPQSIVDAIVDRIELDITPEKVKSATEELQKLTAEAKERAEALNKTE